MPPEGCRSCRCESEGDSTDLHYQFSSETLSCKVFDGSGSLLMEFPMHDAAVNGPGFGHWGRCPRGRYRLGEPIVLDHPAFGFWFTPLLSVPGRTGVGIHGGGTGLAHPLIPRQSPPWIPTHGCLRVLNEDNDRQVKLRRYGDDACITVEGP